MAANRKYAGNNTTLPLTKAFAQTASRTSNKPISGDPVRIGKIPGVALLDADANGKTVVQIDGVFNVLVAGKDNSGTGGADANSAVLGGDAIYFSEGDTPPLSKRTDGILFGHALGDHAVQLVAAGSTTTAIDVLVGA